MPEPLPVTDDRHPIRIAWEDLRARLRVEAPELSDADIDLLTGAGDIAVAALGWLQAKLAQRAALDTQERATCFHTLWQADQALEAAVDQLMKLSERS